MIDLKKETAVVTQSNVEGKRARDLDGRWRWRAKRRRKKRPGDILEEPIDRVRNDFKRDVPPEWIGPNITVVAKDAFDLQQEASWNVGIVPLFNEMGNV